MTKNNKLPPSDSEELIVRIKDGDFSSFSGYYYTDSTHTENNEKLNAYIQLYKTTDSIKYFQIECRDHFPMHTIAYIINKIDEDYFIQTEFDLDDVKKKRYWLCFYKGDKNKNG